MRSYRGFAFVAASLLAAMCISLPLPSVLGQLHPSARDQMEVSRKRRLDAEADRLHMTPDQLRSLDAATTGKPLLYDPNHMVTVSWFADSQDAAREIHITADPKGPEAISIAYRLGSGDVPSSVTYSATQPTSPRAAIWKDLNADGVFDVLIIPIGHNELLNLDRGTYILVDGKWIAGQVMETNPPSAVVGDAKYNFGVGNGIWHRSK